MKLQTEGKNSPGAGKGSFRADRRLGGGARAPSGEDGQGSVAPRTIGTTGARGDHRLFRERDLPAAGRGATGLSSQNRVPAQDDGVDGGEADGGRARRPDPVGDEPAQPVHQEVSRSGSRSTNTTTSSGSSSSSRRQRAYSGEELRRDPQSRRRSAGRVRIRRGCRGAAPRVGGLERRSRG